MANATTTVLGYIYGGADGAYLCLVCGERTDREAPSQAVAALDGVEECAECQRLLVSAALMRECADGAAANWDFSVYEHSAEVRRWIERLPSDFESETVDGYIAVFLGSNRRTEGWRGASSRVYDLLSDAADNVDGDA